jgi:hypothetical protein
LIYYECIIKTFSSDLSKKHTDIFLL